MQAYLIEKFLAIKCLICAFSENLKKPLKAADDSKGYTIIPFVPHTMIFAVKTAQT